MSNRSGESRTREVRNAKTAYDPGLQQGGPANSHDQYQPSLEQAGQLAS